MSRARVVAMMAAALFVAATGMAPATPPVAPSVMPPAPAGDSSAPTSGAGVASTVRPDGRDSLRPAADSKRIAGSTFVRRKERDDERVTLQVASRTYADPQGGPSVSLVGAVHIADGAYYAAMQRLLDEHDAVLYESVTPRGAVKWAALVERDPALATRESMLFLRRLMLVVRDREPDPDASRAEAAAPPVPTIQRTIDRAGAIDSRMPRWAHAASIDAWGREIECEVSEDGSFLLISRGADRAPGGEGVDADIRLRTPRERRAGTASMDDGIQAALAKALGLEFQLQAVDYGSTRWEVADMSEGELNEALAARGVAGGEMLRSLSGEGITAGAARAILALLRMADGISGGSLREAARLFLIEALSEVDEHMLGEGLGGGLKEVILDERNAVAMRSLEERRSRGDGVRSIAVFYGAAHMPDLERRLLERGFVRGEERWFDAMSADPAHAGIDREQLEGIRRTLRELRSSSRGAGTE